MNNERMQLGYLDVFNDLNAKNILASEVSGNFGLFNNIDLNNVDILSLSGVNIIISSGSISLTNRPTVNGVGVLLSGEASSASLPNTIVYTTGDQIIFGNKIFVNNINISGTGSFNAVKVSSIDKLFLSGIDMVVTGNSSINVYNPIYISGNPVLTGIIPTSQTISNVFYTTGDQIISGNKTFLNNVNISGTGNFNNLKASNIDKLFLSGIDIILTGNSSINVYNPIYISGNPVLTGIIPTSQNIANVVYTTGSQTISEVKTFNDGLATKYISGVSGSSLNIISFSGQGININAGNSLNSVAGNVTLTAGNGSSNVIAGSINLIAGTGQQGDGTTPVGINLYAGRSPRYDGTNNIFGNINVNYNTNILDSPVIAPKTISIYRSGNAIVPFPTPTIVPAQLLGVLIDNNKVDVNNGMALQVSGVSVTPGIYVDRVNNQIITGAKTFIDSGIFSNGAIPAVPLLNNPLSIVGSGNNYLQLNIQNRGTGTDASADLVITANNGTDNSNFINLGINNSGYSNASYTNGSGLDGYLFINGGSLDIGTQTPNTSIEFHAGGTTASKVIARITESGLNLVSGNLTVNNTGVLLNGQNSFTIFMQVTNSNPANDAISYFNNLPGGPSSIASNKMFQIGERCVARKASWNQYLDTFTGIPNQNATGYFINVSTQSTGVISTIINANTFGNSGFSYIGPITPNVTVNETDYVVCGLKWGNYTVGFRPSGWRAGVNIYCYN
jgi:hypothetical protein